MSDELEPSGIGQASTQSSIERTAEGGLHSDGSGRGEQRSAGSGTPMVAQDDHGSPLLALGQLEGAMLAQRRTHSERAGLRVELDSGLGSERMESEHNATANKLQQRSQEQ